MLPARQPACPAGLSSRLAPMNHFGQLIGQHGLGKNKSCQHYRPTPYATNRNILHRLWTHERTEPSSGAANRSIVLFRCAEMTQPRAAPNPNP